MHQALLITHRQMAIEHHRRGQAPVFETLQGPSGFAVVTSPSHQAAIAVSAHDMLRIAAQAHSAL